MFIFLLLPIACIACTTILKDMPMFLQLKNNIHVEHLVVVSDGEMECQSNDINCNGILSEMLLGISELPMTFFNIERNSIDKFESIIESSTLSLIILFNFDESMILRGIMHNISSYGLSKNAWLVTLPQEQTQHRTTMIDILQSNFGGLKNLQIDSQLYVLSSLNEHINLFEIYKTCARRPLITNMIFNYGNSSEFDSRPLFIWKRRKNLEGCEMRIAYINIKSFFEVKFINN